jgi:hypothetical protein
MVRRQITLKRREETMKMRAEVTLVALAISFALPTFAQQTDTPIHNYANGLSRSFKNITTQS